MMYNGTYGEFQIPFTTLSLDYTAASASTTILFTVTGTNLGGQDPLIDGISFDQTSNTGTPEPGTYFTGFIGLGLLAMRLIPKTTRMLSK